MMAYSRLFLRARCIPFALAAASLAALLASCKGDPVAPFNTRFDGPVIGCGDFVAYRFNTTKLDAIGVSANREQLRLGALPRTFDIANPPEGLRVFLDRYTHSNSGERYCTDVIVGGWELPATWQARGGQATISVTADSVMQGEIYRATVTLRDVVFIGPAGESAVVDSATIPDATVGWYPG